MTTIRTTARRAMTTSVAPLLILLAACAPPREFAAFGEYTNDATALFDGSNRYSVYVSAADGTRLAVDYFLPTAEGVEATGPLPAVLHYTRYIRAFEADGEVRARGQSDGVLTHLLRHGYAVVVADARGTGASFGVHWGAFSREETRDASDVIAWIAAQPWSSGNVGMQGRSYPGMTQYQAATQAPPALKAIFAEMAGPDPYAFAFAGGTFKEEFIEAWGRGTELLDRGERGRPAPVDADPDGALVEAAIAEHADNLWAHELVAEAGAEHRDWEIEPAAGARWSWTTAGTIDDIEAIAASGVAVYHLSGWYDIYTTQQPMLFANLDGHPQKLMMGPWVHSGGYGGRVHRAEVLRWFDHWLKGLDTGVMDDAPVHYYVMTDNHTLPDDPEAATSFDEQRAEDGSTWQASASWPPAGTSPATWYLEAGPSGSIASINDGRLSADAPSSADGADRYVVDFDARVGSFSRWMNGHGGRRDVPEGTTFFDERTAEDARVLTYTSEPFEVDAVVLGSPIVRLWVESSHPDGDLFAYLEEVDTAGRSHYVTEGALRLSHRGLADAPWDTLGLPFHRGLAADHVELPGGPVEAVFDLLATGIRIDAGHRIRLAIAGADAANYERYPDPSAGAPTVTIHRGVDRVSTLVLPIVTPDR